MNPHLSEAIGLGGSIDRGTDLDVLVCEDEGLAVEGEEGQPILHSNNFETEWILGVLDLVSLFTLTQLLGRARPAD